MSKEHLYRLILQKSENIHNGLNDLFAWLKSAEKRAALTQAAELIEAQRMLIEKLEKELDFKPVDEPENETFVRGSHLDNAFASHLKNHPQPWLRFQ